MKTKACYMKKIYKINKPSLVNQKKQKRERVKIPIANVRNERGAITNPKNINKTKC